MNNLIRLLIFGGLAACAILIFMVGLARNDAELLAPLNLILFAIALLIYFLPSLFALYRNCHATGWITLVNLLLGWTIFGWFVAMGWAASGRADGLPPQIHTPPGSPVTGHS
jgi:hypothetical protein